MTRSRLLREAARQVADAAGGAALTVLSLAALEGALALGGVDARLPPPAHLAAGFAPDAPYVVPDPDVPGGWRTQYTHSRVSEVAIPPKGDATRVILFGGSNTHSFDAAVLADELRSRAGGPGSFEVVNLGRPGYGSARVAILFRQALERLEPDVAVVYAGHNEFVEQSFAIDVDGGWSDRWARRAARWLSATRTVRCMAELVDGRGDGGEVPRHARPEAWEREYKKLAGLRWSDTQRFWDAYERNLRYLCELAEARGVRLVLSTVVYNRFSAPRVSTPDEDVDTARFAAFLEARRTAVLPAELGPLLPRSDADRVHAFDWGRPGELLPEGELQAPLPGLRPPLDDPALQARLFPVQRRWEPKVRALYEALATLHAGVPEDGRAQAAQALAALDRALEAYPDHPRTLYERALLAYWLGARGDAVRAGLELAARRDRAPRNGNGASNDRVRLVAGERAEVLFVDADGIFVERSPGGLVGWEWMKDHCHLNDGGARDLMADFARAMADAWFGEAARDRRGG